MPGASRTSWRRFLLLEQGSAWSARQVRRRPELAHIPPTDPYFASRAITARFLRRGLPVIAATIATMLLIWYAWGFVAQAVLTFMQHPVDANSQGSSRASVHACVVSILVAQWVTTLGAGVWMTRWSSRRRRRTLRGEVRRRGVPICIACGYESGDIHSPRCPECGAPVSS